MRRLVLFVVALSGLLVCSVPALADDICTSAGFGTAGGETLTRFSTATGAASTTTYGGANLALPAVSPNNATVYVPDATGDRVLVVRGGDGGDTGTRIAVGDRPVKVLFHPSGTRAYVLNAGASTVSIVDVATHSVLATTPTIAPAAVDIALRADGTALYVLSSGGGATGLAVLDAATATTTPLTLSSAPTSATHLAVAGSVLVVADDALNRLGTVSSSGGTFAYGLLSGAPTALAVSPDGATAYVGVAGPALEAMTVATLTAASPAAAVGSIGSIAVGPTGTVVAAETTKLRTYTAAGVATGTAFDLALSSVTICSSTATVPGVPTAVKGTRGDTAIAVAWTAPVLTGGAAIESYEVTATPGGATCTAHGATTCTVTGLRNGTGYSFTVRARNAVGWGGSSTKSDAIQPRRDTSARPLAMTPVVVRVTKRAVVLSAKVTTAGAGVIAQVAMVKSKRYCTMSRAVPAAGTYGVRCVMKAAGRKLVRLRRTSFLVRTTFTPRLGPLAVTRQEVAVARRR